jgi:hypothetical protein
MFQVVMTKPSVRGADTATVAQGKKITVHQHPLHDGDLTTIRAQRLRSCCRGHAFGSLGGQSPVATRHRRAGRHRIATSRTVTTAIDRRSICP